jgi:tape measure domain-containing protein
MRFDNKHFEDNVQTSLGTIKQLRQSLNLTDASKGLEGVSAAAKQVDLSGISGAAETVGLKFSALYTIADQALRNITNSAMNYGKKIVSALTVDPVKTGFSEYETKMGSIQTIMSNTASKGTTMEDVTRVIDELNTYADKTIYNFAEMTRNIGTFTAAGVGLEESASAIQGIANLAAASGSTSQQASTAMYQLSQALSTGTVKLMDWNSVTNAGMGGEKFQEALKATAREHGVAVDSLIEKNGSFRESLQEGWLSADILNATLRKFTVEGAKEYGQSMMEAGKWTQAEVDALVKEAQSMEDAATKVKTFTQLWDTLKESAQSGWSQTWEIIVGDFEEAKETLTKISDILGGVIGKSSEARNNLLQGWKDLGGRQALVDALWNAFEGIKNVVTPIGEAFREIFPALEATQLLSVTEKLRDSLGKFAEAFKAGSKNAENLKRTFKGLFAVVDIVRMVFVAVIKAVGSLFGGVGELGGGILDITASIGDWLVKLRDAIAAGDIFGKVFKGIAAVARVVIGVISKLVRVFSEKIVTPGFDGLGTVLDKIRSGMSKIGDVATSMKNGVVNAVESIGSAFSGSSFFKFIQALGKALVTIGVGIGKAFGELAGGLFSKILNADFSNLLDLVSALSAGGIALAITKFVKGFSGLTDGLGDALGTFGELKNGVVGILDEVKGCFEAYQNQLKAGTLMKIAQAIAILTAAIVVLSFIDSAKLSSALGAITVLFTDLMVAMGLFSRISGDLKNTTKAVAGMIGLSTAVLILSIALANIARFSPSELITGIGGIVALTAVMVSATKALGKDKKTVVKGAMQMILFATAVKVLASVVKTLSNLSWDQLTKGLVGVGVLLAEVSLFMNTAKFSGKAMTTATGIVILAASLKIMASACKDFASMSGDELRTGLISVGAVLAALTAFTKLTSGSTNMLSIGIGMIAIGAAMKIFASAISDLGSISWDILGKGLLTMAVALTAITVAVNFMPKTMALSGIGLIAMATGMILLASALKIMGGMSWGEIVKSLVAISGALTVLFLGLLGMPLALPGAAALLVIAAALLTLTPVLLLLGSMSWGSIVKGLVAIAGTFTILGVAGAVLAPLVPAILGLAAAIALLGVGVLTAGVGLSLLAAGLTALAAIGTASAASIAATLTIIATSIINLIPLIIQKIGEGLIALCKVIAEGAPAICEAAIAVMLSLIEAINTVLPPLMECIGLIIEEVLKLLIKYTPDIIDAALQLIVALLEGIASKMDDIVSAAVDIIVAFIDGIASGLPRIIDSGINLMVSFVNGLADGIRKNTTSMINAVNNLMDAIMEAIAAYFKNAVTKGGELIDKLKSGAKAGISGLKQAGKDAIQGFINGITEKLSAAADAAKKVGKAALDGIKNLLGIKSPSREFMAVGRFSGEGMIAGLDSYSGKVAHAAADVGSTALDSMKHAVSRLSDVISGDINTEPTIRPVLDLSDVRSGANTIGNLLNGEHSMGVLANVGAISSTIGQNGQNGSNDDVVSAINKLRQDLGKVGGTSYHIGGITYDDGSNVAHAVRDIARAVKIERRI